MIKTKTIQDRSSYLVALKEALPDKPIGAELGVLKGDFSEMILSIVDPARLVLIDPFKKGGKSYNEGLGWLTSAYSTDREYEIVCSKFVNEDRIWIIRDFSYDAIFCIVDKYFDFIYHDASHLYEDVRRVLKDWFPKLKNGGIICGHDYVDHPSFGVKKAVDEFCEEHNFEMIIFNENGGDYALRAIQ
jgi:hypothetical protein